jgi:hypothetical protein
MLIPYEVARYFTGTDFAEGDLLQGEATSSMVEPAATQITGLIKLRHRPTSVYHARDADRGPR